jgi:hypothetical protein
VVGEPAEVDEPAAGPTWSPLGSVPSDAVLQDASHWTAYDQTTAPQHDEHERPGAWS